MDPEAKFWMLKYFELLGHSSQVATQLARPFLREAAQAQASAAANLLKPSPTEGGSQ